MKLVWSELAVIDLENIKDYISKDSVYYALKFTLLSALLLEGSLISTPLAIQFVMMFLFSGYIFLSKK